MCTALEARASKSQAHHTVGMGALDESVSRGETGTADSVTPVHAREDPEGAAHVVSIHELSVFLGSSTYPAKTMVPVLSCSSCLRAL